MGKNVILSEHTVRDLLEAYASLSGWYYQLWGALRSGSNSADPPTEAVRLLFLERLGRDYPELSALAQSVQTPRMFVPPPVAIAPPAPIAVPAPAVVSGGAIAGMGAAGVGAASVGAAGVGASAPMPVTEDAATLVEPAPARLREMKASEPPPPAYGGVAPPPFVAPGTVKENS